jgi:hypothetical protein
LNQEFFLGKKSWGFEYNNSKGAPYRRKGNHGSVFVMPLPQKIAENYAPECVITKFNYEQSKEYYYTSAAYQLPLQPDWYDEFDINIKPYLVTLNQFLLSNNYNQNGE